MAVKYVKDFEFPADFGFQKSQSVGQTVPGKHGSAPAFKRGGSVSTPQPYKHGGFTGAKGANTARDTGISVPSLKHGGKAERNAGILHAHMQRKARGGAVSEDIADAPVPMGKKSSWNKDDAVSPGSSKRTAPKQGMKNLEAAKDKFATKGENTPPATKQTGNVERMSGFSDFKKGGKAKKKMAKGGHCTTPQRYKDGGEVHGDRFERGKTGAETAAPDKKESGDGKTFKHGGRIANLGHYAYGGKVKSTKSEKPSAKVHEHKQSGESVPSTKPAHQEPEPSGGAEPTHEEVRSAEPEMAGGGLTRGVSPKRNAAIHAKHNMGHGPNLGALAGLLGGAGPAGAMKQPQAPGMGPPPPGMAPGMGRPPGAPMGGMAPPPGGAMGPGGPPMAHGGKVSHVMHHHISYKR